MICCKQYKNDSKMSKVITKASAKSQQHAIEHTWFEMNPSFVMSEIDDTNGGPQCKSKNEKIINFLDKILGVGVA